MLGRKNGQMTVEYTVMFAVIVAVAIWASINVVKPSVNRFFNSTGRIMNKATDQVEATF